ncbi:hypothetical protein [Methylopila turkensis]|uniref:Uncharacterized protein n=1 Tax=Methylopila turkensis TaxID=1437816 RepID=A0A9W6JLG6_9HYPH|nr:hypothetical protein [Methylopila turkensis]GLK78378.1 hypothetical protein GCM10008174_01190 [Methylopila turkensis]
MDIDPFEQGLIAAANGGSLNDNPYEAGSEEHRLWDEGFLQGARDAEPAGPE